MRETDNYPQGRTIFGSDAEIDKSFAAFSAQHPDEIRLAPDDTPPLPAHRTTIAAEMSVSGVGTFRGKERRTLTFAPSSIHGWHIRRTDQSEQLDTSCDISNLWTSARNLVLRSGSPHNYLRMVEHIIALKAGMGVDDVVIKTNSGDPPLFDKSSIPLVEALESAKIIETAEKASYTTVAEPLRFGGKRGDFLLFIPAKPGQKFLRLDVAISWNTVIGSQRIILDVTPSIFKYGAFARTNATHRQYQLARTIGLLFAETRNLGYNMQNILIHGRRKFYNTPRFLDEASGKALEPVWHRAVLDLLAAIAIMTPDRFTGTVVSYRAGHTLDCDAVRAIRRRDLLVPFNPQG